MQMLRRMSNDDDDDEDKESWPKKVTRLRPGELAMRGDQAFFNLGQNGDKPVPMTKDGRPTGPVFFNMHPEVIPWPPGASTQCGSLAKQRKTTFHVLPTMPPTTELAVGPVTGMPMNKDEDLFVFRVGKQFDESNNMSRFQMEVRLPKKLGPEQIDVDTQFLLSDILLPVTKVKNSKKGKKGKGAKNKKGGKKKKGASKPRSKKSPGKKAK